MSLSAAVIDAMVASGCTPEQMAAVIKADLIERDAAVETKRAKDAERQRRHRASRDVTVTPCDNADSVTEPLSRPPNEIKSNPPTHTREKQTPRARGHRLPVDWQPGPLPAELASAVSAWPSGALERELARFRDWAASATGPNATKSDWNAAWRNWLRKAEDEGRYRTNDRQRPSFSDRETTRQTGERVAARFAAGGNGPLELVPRLGAPGGHDA